MHIRILKGYTELEPFLSKVQICGDENRKSFGFLPTIAYQDQARQGRLWIAIDNNSNEFVGYLMFGGKFPKLKIFQLFVHRDFRKSGIGMQLLKELIEYGEAHYYLSISARVASDLRANSFWENAGFKLIKQERGGKSTNRTINIRLKELDTPSLFTHLPDAAYKFYGSMSDISYLDRPVSTNVSYVIDLNVFFDVVKKRARSQEASQLIRAGLNNQIRISVTSEFQKELERHSNSRKVDPILQLAGSLPALPEVEKAALDSLITELKVIVFPEKIQIGKCSENDQSDLVHLASCIHHKISGFVTREKAILKSSDELRQTYGLDVLSPTDFVEPDESDDLKKVLKKNVVETQELRIAPTVEDDREDVERFLLRMGVEINMVSTIWNPGASGSLRRRLCIREGKDIVGVASWDAPSRYTHECQLNLYVDESHQVAIRIIDHILETVFRDSEPLLIRRINLSIGTDQIITKRTALERGFRKILDFSGNTAEGSLSKISISGIVTVKTWSDLVDEFKNLTGLELPAQIPECKEFINTGIVLKSAILRESMKVNLFDFETLISPAVVLCPGRAAMLLPIRGFYANELIGDVSDQLSLLPSKEALLHVEKSYFKSTHNVSPFVKGIPVVFYVSGAQGGSKEVIGSGRVTFSEVLPYEETELRFARQGVLSTRELIDMSDRNGNVHVFTFDNFNRFPNRLSFNELKEMGCVSGANLITAEKLTSKQLFRICERSYSVRG